MNLRSTLFGSPRRLVAVVLLLLVVAGAALALGVLGSPTVTDVENRFGGVNDTATVVESNLTVSNPNPIGVSLGGLTVDYAVEMNGIRMAEGTKSGVSVPTGTSELPFTTTMVNERVPTWWASHVRNDERTTLTVDAAVRSTSAGASFGAPKVTREVQTDLLSQFNSTEPRPVNANSAVVSDPIVYVNRTNATWGEVTNATTRLDVTFVVYNPKPYPIGMTEIGYEVSMNDVTVGDGTTGRSVVIPPGETRTVETTTRIRNENLDEWWVSHLERNQVSELRMAFFAHLDLRTTTVRVPLSGVTYTKTIETDIFGTKPDTAGTADDGDPETATEAPNDRPGAGTPNDENGDGAAGTDVSSATPDRTPHTDPVRRRRPTE